MLPALAWCCWSRCPGRWPADEPVAGRGRGLLVSAGWWFLSSAWCRGAPALGGRHRDEAPLDLALGYNGLGRLVGQRSPSGQVRQGWLDLRLFGSAGDQVCWLIPAAVRAGRRRLLTRGAGRTDPVRAAC